MEAEHVMKLLRSLDSIDKDYRVFSDGDSVFIPLKEGSEGLPGIRAVDIEGKPSRVRSLPSGTHGAFDMIGHVAITKMRNRARAEQLAAWLMQRNGIIKSVYLDEGVTGEYRTRRLSLIAGEDRPETEYKENGCSFIMDVRLVYFSPRLATERMLVAKSVSDEEKILDMFAGLGPFSINIARIREAVITAVDSNPYAISYMKRSLAMNRLKGKITPILGDAGSEIKKMGMFNRIIMNLPHNAFQYLPVAIGHLSPGGVLNYYEILDQESLETRMEQFRDMGFQLISKRVVHGYSPRESMFSLWLKMP